MNQLFDTTEQNNLISSSTVCCPDIHYSLCNSINLDNDFQSQKMSNIIFMITSIVFEISFYIEYFIYFNFELLFGKQTNFKKKF